MNVQINRVFFNAIFSEPQKYCHFDSGVSQLYWHISTEYILLKKTPKLKNAQKHAVVSGYCFELNSPPLRQCYIKRNVEFMSVFNSEYIQTSLPFQKGGMGKEEQEGMDRGFLISTEKKQCNEI